MTDPAERNGRRTVVGVDGSPGARTALAWALADAVHRRVPVTVLTGVPIPVTWSAEPTLLTDHLEEARADTERRARELVAEVAREVRAEGVPVEVVADVGPPAARLVGASAGAGLLVVGTRGRGAVASALLGSVALHCVTHAPCDVVVVPPGGASPVDRPRVVVGVDGSSPSAAGLVRAVEEAILLRAELQVVAAYSAYSYWSDVYDVVVPPAEQLREDARRGSEALVRDALAGASPAPPVQIDAVEGPAGEVLVSRGRGASLLVVGGRGHGKLVGLLVGSVALHCVLHAPCPVLVVRPEPGPRPA